MEHPMIPPRNPTISYREQQVFNAGPIQRLLMVYDVAITACNQKDLSRLTQALNLLRSTLDFDQGDASVRLFRLYQYSNDQARVGNWDEAARVLRELVQAWVEVLVRETDSRRKQAPVQRSVYVAA
jgi:flagellin-specific chaperone FliS